MRSHQSPKQLPRQPAGGEDNKLQPPPPKKEESFYFCLPWTLPLPWSWIAMRCLLYLVPTTTQGLSGKCMKRDSPREGFCSFLWKEMKRKEEVEKTNKLMLLELSLGGDDAQRTWCCLLGLVFGKSDYQLSILPTLRWIWWLFKCSEVHVVRTGNGNLESCSNEVTDGFHEYQR